MNDPGFDPAITETANEVEDRVQDGSKEPDGRDSNGYVHWASANRQLGVICATRKMVIRRHRDSVDSSDL